MMITTSIVRRSLAGIAAAVLFCAAAYAQEGDERRNLLKREQQASDKTETQRREQDYLLFLKTLLSADSKYLILDLRTGRGMLKYRNRVLRSFEFPGRGKDLPPAFAPRAVSLSGKRGGAPRNRQLIFSDSILIIHGKHTKVSTDKGKSPVHVSLGTKDLAALFYVMEPGSMAYLID